MNKNIVKYPIRFGTLLLAGAALVACQKTQFTEQDAWNLEKSRLQTLSDLQIQARAAAEKERQGALIWNRVRDSLNNINAGGRVYYTVIPVAANEAATSGGRTETAIENARVTITQYGRAFTNADAAGANGTPLNPGGGATSAKNGVYTFSELRSGEVTVSIDAPNFTQVNYVANLTPDGGVSNNGTVNVGNIIPMFELATVAGTKMATLRGQAWYEGDLTNDREEVLSGAILGVGTNLVTASIDVSGTFRQRFLHENFDESGSQYLGVATRSGFIQRFSYSKAVTAAAPDANGFYSMLVPASVTGLPIKLNFSEFAFNRSYFNNSGVVINGTGATAANTERFLYGPNVAPSSIPNPGTPSASLEVRAWDTDASASATFTAQTTGAQPTNFNRTETYLNANAASNRGFYAMAPTVTTAAGTSTAAATFAVETDANFLPYVSTTAGLSAADAAAISKSFKVVNATVITNTGGTGYSVDQDLIFTRTDLVTGAGFGGQAAGTGNAGGYVNLSGTTPIQVTDGGAGFLRNPAATVSTPATFTNYLPTVVFTETNDVAGADPILGYNALVPAVTAATARVFVDYNATYTADNRGILATAGNPPGLSGVGSIQEVRMITTGAYPSGRLPFVNFSFGESRTSGGFVSTPGAVAPALLGKSLFVSNGAGGVKFNQALTAGELSSLFAGAAGTVDGGGSGVTFTTGYGSAYTFVPRVELVANAAATAAGGATLTNSLSSVGVTTTVDSAPLLAPVAPATVGLPNPNFGKIVKLVLNTPITVSFAGGTVGVLDRDFLQQEAPFAATAGTGNHQISVTVRPSRYGNTLAAVGGATTGATLATGSALNTYSFTPSAQTVAAASAAALAGALGGAVSNSTTNSLTTAELVRGNNMLLVFDAPDNTAFVGRRTSYGVPVWNNNTLLGARILDGGSGYGAAAITVGTTNFTSGIKATLVPNPWFAGNQPVAGNTGPSSLTGTVGQDIIGFLNSANMMASGKAFRPAPAITRARLALTVTPGSGYSRAPRFVVSGGGLNLTEYNSSLAGVNRVSPSSGGVITFASRINSAGAVQWVGNTTTLGLDGLTNSNPSSPAGNTASMVTPGLSQIYTTSSGALTTTGTGNTRVDNNFWFDVDKAPNYNTATSPLVVTVIEELSVRLTQQLNATEASGNGVGARVGIAATTAVPTGTVTSVTFNDGRSAMLMDDATATRMDQVDIQTGTVAAIGSLVPGPRINVVGNAGTGATLQSYVTLDPNRPNLHRRITSIVVTAGGSGYGAARRNSYWRSTTGTSNGTPNGGTTGSGQNNNAGQVFTIVGGMGGVSNAPGTNMSNMSFDAMPGITLVRDVHYGTGVILD
jgi:hypothetical protein